MEIDWDICNRARHSRDARFDGRFVIGVISTGIYCRPICPSRTVKDENVRYYPTTAAAEAAGFRPCLRCRPEASPGTPAWLGTSGLVSRALRLIGDGALDEDGVDPLADRLGVTARHLRRLFLQHLGATPLQVALTRRVHFAKKLIDETALPFDQVAFAAGFGSVRRFNGQIRRTYHRTPSELRRLAQRGLAQRQEIAASESYRFRLAYRPPYDWDAMLAFLGARATPGVEDVRDGMYRRTIALEGKTGTLEVSRHATALALVLEVRFPEARALLLIVERVRRLFDLGADPLIIERALRADPELRAPLRAHPGIRVPGAWDPFELAVRAVLEHGAPLSAATAQAAALTSRFGERVKGEPGLERLFPTPDSLASAALERAGISPDRARTLRALARRTSDGDITFRTSVDARATLAVLEALPGMAPSIAEYIAMRALGEPDAFPSHDRALRRAADDCTARELERRSQSWRPWRAYVAMLLWEAETKEETCLAGLSAAGS